MSIITKGISMEITSNNRVVTVCLVILTIIGSTHALIYTQSVLVPFVISLFIYLALVPALSFLQGKLKVSHNLAVGIIAIGYLLISALLVLIFVQSFETVLDQAGLYRVRVLELMSKLTELVPGLNSAIDINSIKDQLAQLPVLKILKGITGDIFGLLGNSTLIVIFTIFLLLGDPTKNENSLVKEFQVKLSRYVVAKLFISALTSIVTGIVLLSVGADLALLFALVTFLLNFIPNIGSLIAIALPLPVLFLQFGFTTPFWVALIICGVAQFVIGNILEPKMLGDSLDLHPVVVLLFLMFWGLVWGVPGMFLAVPITSLLKILFSRIEVTKPISELLAGRF
ncbi:MAG: hypothetical protein COW01_14190 [Bdellovibrionales bacterium CG12_big_fil_rev_8_21_14_0_65_38_15]|nr:MAG: hypothetical protein COW79_17010 [Bdellovibrionales bacterium CG22_combo_CG10-13_8_21_14_all_38_13]PIQ53423.1 MAG: hypothetical protein COW01_14190 [Bdellovibrionales bacterium CG12_big_fil_rev_8_21_14_0_65_38_15]PIR30214.1 MAG: hypothetical protein COV38_05565 [Bdellovibrionales bacterium CG11_big_fil_rev_8_21_14_0_20_38_13]